MSGKIAIIIIVVSVIFSCSVLKDLSQMQKPQVTVQNVRLTDLNFRNITLNFDIGIQNPNKLAVSLSKLDYELFLNENSFLQGEEVKDITIASEATSTVELPVTLDFSNIYSTVKSLQDRDSTAYRLEVGLGFNLPVLGETTIPLKKSGSFPLLKWPSIKVASLDVQQLGLTGATLNLKLQLDNPNSLNLLLKQLNYNFTVNGNSWLNGNLSSMTKVEANNDVFLDVPFRMDFLKMGQTVYQVISGGQEIRYNFSGDLDIGSSNDLLKEVSMPFNKDGSLKIGQK